MTNKLIAIFTTPSGLTLLATFLIAGLKAIETHFTGSALTDIQVIVAFLGMLLHPTEMVAGRKV